MGRRGTILSAVAALVLLAPGCPASDTRPEPDAGALLDSTAPRDSAGPDGPATGCTDPDVDRDGHDALACGGNDCDDGDPMRAPGRPEICDPDDRDEDCDVTTYGFRDRDTDGEGDAACCNVQGGTRTCGTDCDDARPSVSSTGTETCNAIDDDCDRAIDEGATVTLYLDADGDGHGGASSRVGCPGEPGTSTMSGDCDDAAPGRNPAAPEVCNGIDDDCDAVLDDIVEGTVVCEAGSSSSCTTSCGGLAGTRSCGGDCLSFGPCTASEACNACDDDGNGAPDDTFACVRGTTTLCTTACGTPGAQTCASDCTLATCSGTEICNFCDDNGVAGIAEERPQATYSDGPRAIYGGPGGTSVYAGVASEDTEPTGVGSAFDIYAELLDGAAADQAGAFWVPLERYQGWGPTTIEAELRVRAPSGGTVMGGWSIVVATGTAGGVGAPAGYGVPSGLSGARVEWVWGFRDPWSPFGEPSFSDALAYARNSGPYRGARWLDSGRNDLSPGADFDGGTGWLVQFVTIVYTPDDPLTPATEERVAITARGGPLGAAPVSVQSLTFVPDADGDTVDPENDVPVASRLTIGFTAGSYTHAFTPPGGPTVTVGTPVVARLWLRRFHPPTGPGAPTWDDWTTIRRTGLCAGPF